MIITLCFFTIMVVLLFIVLRNCSIAKKGIKNSDRYRKFLFYSGLIAYLIAAVCLVGGFIGVFTGDFQCDTNSYDITIKDKWQEGSMYYFVDTKNNVYIITEPFSYEFRDNLSWTKSLTKRNYEMMPYIRYKNLIIGENYKVNTYYGLFSTRCIKEVLYKRNKGGGD